MKLEIAVTTITIIKKRGVKCEPCLKKVKYIKNKLELET